MTAPLSLSFITGSPGSGEVMTRGLFPVNARPFSDHRPKSGKMPPQPILGCFSTKKHEFRDKTTVKLTYLGQNRLNFLANAQIPSRVFFLLLTSGHRIRGRIPWVPGPT
ncbi:MULTISPECIES: hypothetical protein [unclassified Shinella]|uniref:hypothetical protein n=1 Tax=unclassified Shinella TaxID=2643062 RepID=UPI00234F9C13|nr:MULTISPECIES: hypothetical protein [unclassified Shinella]MCO5140970.1 hypothetical protein [Shinella sp.]MDC7257233.1 hypothetical protein [Shinella sp. YE25]